MLNSLKFTMLTRGKFVVLEGIDGSGKHTQMELLGRSLAERAIDYARVGFPNYDGFFGKLVAQFLNGDFGPLDAVDPHFSAMLYANDRLESKPAMESELAAGKLLLADRYVASNLAHQGARTSPEKRAEFLRWLAQLEYDVYKLPHEDLVIYLRVPPAEAHRLVAQKGKREYTALERDLQEQNMAHLEAASGVYDELAKQPGWVTIQCYSPAAKALRAPASIHEEIRAAIESRLLSAGRSAR
jgi:dTMP kinase